MLRATPALPRTLSRWGGSGAPDGTWYGWARISAPRLRPSAPPPGRREGTRTTTDRRQRCGSHTSFFPHRRPTSDRPQQPQAGTQAFALPGILIYRTPKAHEADRNPGTLATGLSPAEPHQHPATPTRKSTRGRAAHSALTAAARNRTTNTGRVFPSASLTTRRHSGIAAARSYRRREAHAMMAIFSPRAPGRGHARPRGGADVKDQRQKNASPDATISTVNK